MHSSGNPVKKSAKTVRCGGGEGTTQVYPDDGLKIPPEQLNQICAKRLKVYTEHVAN